MERAKKNEPYNANFEVIDTEDWSGESSYQIVRKFVSILIDIHIVIRLAASMLINH